ncbi:hypothetical protein FACS189472_14670 [Alphaproteobacteria bacterium]|nr:hypothetical protein FACS189472_14670 [Alphaproteobacteria bacterium]
MGKLDKTNRTESANDKKITEKKPKEKKSKSKEKKTPSPPTSPEASVASPPPPDTVPNASPAPTNVPEKKKRQPSETVELDLTLATKINRFKEKELIRDFYVFDGKMYKPVSETKQRLLKLQDNKHGYEYFYVKGKDGKTITINKNKMDRLTYVEPDPDAPTNNEENQPTKKEKEKKTKNETKTEKAKITKSELKKIFDEPDVEEDENDNVSEPTD